MESEGAAWAAALESMRGDPALFVGVGPRVSQDWGHDVNAVMGREVGDPRGWVTVDDVHGSRQEGCRSELVQDRNPFEELSDEVLQGSLNQVPRQVARHLLALVVTGFRQARKIPDISVRATNLADDADTLLSRFGAKASYWTNVDDFPEASDFLDARVSEWGSLTKYPVDYGIVVLSETEIGVFWAFDSA